MRAKPAAQGLPRIPTQRAILSAVKLAFKKTKLRPVRGLFGGKGIERACALEPWQTQATWDVWTQYGNMSSATVLFVLDKLLKQTSDYQYALTMAFGPGLSLEGILLARATN